MSTTNRSDEVRSVIWRNLPVWCTCALVAAAIISSRASAQAPRQFASPEDAVKAFIAAVKGGQLADLVAILGAEGTQLIESSDPATGRQNQKVFIVAVGEQWRLEDADPNRKTLVIGNEEWPFPVPLVQDGNNWRFDTAAGKAEVLARRIGRNELAAIRICATYVAAQRRYAEHGHDGKPVGLYAQTFSSDAGKENGLFWPEVKGKRLSPLGDLVAQAASEGQRFGEGQKPMPFQGYYFKILTAQGDAAPGGAKSYVASGNMSGGFALVAWPAEYDLTGIMTFIVNHDGIVYEKDLGPESAAMAGKMTQYDPDASWKRIE